MQKNTIQSICFDFIGVFVLDGKVNEEVVSIARKVKKAGIMTLCYSNTSSTYVSNFDFLDIFDKKYFSDTIGMKSVAGYARCAKEAGVKPETCLVIDDNEFNVLDAKDVGFMTYYFDHSEPSPAAALKKYLQSMGIIAYE